MSVAKSIYKLLSDDAAVAAIVGTKINPLRVPQTRDFPAIAYSQITNIPNNQKDGVSGFDKVDYDIDLMSKDKAQLEDLGTKVRTALDRKSISSQGSTIDTIVFIREFDGFSDNAMIYQKTMQFRFIVLR